MIHFKSRTDGISLSLNFVGVLVSIYRSERPRGRGRVDLSVRSFCFAYEVNESKKDALKNNKPNHLVEYWFVAGVCKFDML